ncbi:MAG: hypothetical protein AAGH53_09220 [Pseudomonadota bacterium]
MSITEKAVAAICINAIALSAAVAHPGHEHNAESDHAAWTYEPVVALAGIVALAAFYFWQRSNNSN